MTESLFDNSFYLIRAMLDEFQQSNPRYPVDTKRDFPALRSIATFLASQAKTGGQPDENSLLMAMWKKICQYIVTDPFYSQKSLSTISNHIQELVIKTAHGDNNARSKKNTTEALASKLNERFR